MKNKIINFNIYFNFFNSFMKNSYAGEIKKSFEILMTKKTILSNS